MNEGRTILLADDCEDDRRLMRSAFKHGECGHPLQEVRNGEEAIAYLSGEGPYGDRGKFPMPVVLLLDLNMPKKNGFDVVSWVRTQPEIKYLPVFILTASARHVDVECAFFLGATSYLVKPSNFDTLVAMMRCLCDWIQINHFPPLLPMNRINEAGPVAVENQSERTLALDRPLR